MSRLEQEIQNELDYFCHNLEKIYYARKEKKPSNFMYDHLDNILKEIDTISQNFPNLSDEVQQLADIINNISEKMYSKRRCTKKQQQDILNAFDDFNHIAYQSIIQDCCENASKQDIQDLFYDHPFYRQQNLNDDEDNGDSSKSLVSLATYYEFDELLIYLNEKSKKPPTKNRNNFNEQIYYALTDNNRIKALVNTGLFNPEIPSDNIRKRWLDDLIDSDNHQICDNLAILFDGLYEFDQEHEAAKAFYEFVNHWDADRDYNHLTTTGLFPHEIKIFQNRQRELRRYMSSKLGEDNIIRAKSTKNNFDQLKVKLNTQSGQPGYVPNLLPKKWHFFPDPTGDDNHFTISAPKGKTYSFDNTTQEAKKDIEQTIIDVRFDPKSGVVAFHIQSMGDKIDKQAIQLMLNMVYQVNPDSYPIIYGENEAFVKTAYEMAIDDWKRRVKIANSQTGNKKYPAPPVLDDTLIQLMNNPPQDKVKFAEKLRALEAEKNKLIKHYKYTNTIRNNMLNEYGSGKSPATEPLKQPWLPKPLRRYD